MAQAMAHEFNVLALVKGAERYVFVYDDASRRQLAEAFRAYAADPQMSLTWFDAMVLQKKADEQCADTWPTLEDVEPRLSVEES